MRRFKRTVSTRPSTFFNLSFVMAILFSLNLSAQKIKGTYIGGDVDLTSVTVINRGADPKSIAEELSYNFALQGIDAYSQSNFGENTKISKENVASKYAITFRYTYNGYGMLYTLNLNVYDVEQNAKLVGVFKWKGFGKNKTKLTEKFVEVLTR